MAEETKKTKKKRLHLHEIRSTQARDGSIVHHHVFKENADADPMPERGPMATSSSPEEAGQHVQEQFAMNQGAAGGGAAEPDGDEAQASPGGGAVMPG
jgi:hypothetical protein